MAKITQYPAKTVPSNNDEFVLHDTAAGSTKKMTRGDLIGGAPLPADSVDEQAITDGAVTAGKKKATTFTGEMTTGGSITASYKNFASQALPSTGAAHKYLINASFSIFHGQSSGREYTVAIRNDSTVVRSSRTDSPANTYRTNASVTAIVTSSGGTINFSAMANATPAGSVQDISQWTIVDLGLA